VRLRYRLIPDWPALAWTAQSGGRDDVTVLHGPRLELRDEWCAEAVWDGDFGQGDFDRCDNVFGTGIRCRGEEVVFVSSSHMLDRLWYCRGQGGATVSNSLPALLAATGLSLREDYDYAHDVKTMHDGLDNHQCTWPVQGGEVSAVHNYNLVLRGDRIEVVSKPDRTPHFACYADYWGFLERTARQLGANLADPLRRHRVTPLTTVSRGYDSCAAAVVAREAGCKDSVTIVNATSLVPRDDSGQEVARRLGLSCRQYRRRPAAYRREETVWAIAGRPAGLNMTVFDYPKPLCLLFTGYRGDALWDVDIRYRMDVFVPFSVDALAMSEFRLFEGILHCPVPFLGAGRRQEVRAIAEAEQMAPWRLRRTYDRPVPRRMLEEAGVERECFGTRKEATSAEGPFVWPFSAEGRRSFAAYLRERGVFCPGAGLRGLLKALLQGEHLLYQNVLSRLGLRKRRLRRALTLRAQDHLMRWANHRLTGMCAEGLRSAGEGRHSP
jgi:hypothetical protein